MPPRATARQTSTPNKAGIAWAGLNKAVNLVWTRRVLAATGAASTRPDRAGCQPLSAG